MTQLLTPRVVDRRLAIPCVVASLAWLATGCEKIVVRDPCVLTVSTSVASVPLERGQTAQVNATAVPTGTCTLQQRFWQSSNAAVAAVSGDGRITGVGAGTATITVTERDETYGTTGVASVAVTVTVPVLVAIPATSPTIDLGAARQLTAIVSGASNSAVQWTSSAPDVVAVSATGLASALGVGVAIVTARSVAVPAKAAATTLTVAVSVAASPAEATMSVGQALPLTAFVLGAVNKQVAWRSSNSAVATVNATGLVTAVGPGTANITATAAAAPSRSGTATITVTGPASVPAGLAHRWTFAQSGGAGTSLLDDVGGAHATIVEVGARDAVAQGGGVTMAGGARNASDYVALPGGLLSRHRSATIEVWGRQLSPRIWARIFDFGSSQTNYLFMAWTQDARLDQDRVEWISPGVMRTVDNTVAPYTVNTDYQVVMTIEPGVGAGGTTRVQWFRDGQFKGSFETPLTLAQLPDTNMWLGRSQYADDETANARYDEVRIYQRALTPAEIAARFTAGPVPNP